MAVHWRATCHFSGSGRRICETTIQSHTEGWDESQESRRDRHPGPCWSPLQSVSIGAEA